MNGDSNELSRLSVQLAAHVHSAVLWVDVEQRVEVGLVHVLVLVLVLAVDLVLQQVVSDRFVITRCSIDFTKKLFA